MGWQIDGPQYVNGLNHIFDIFFVERFKIDLQMFFFSTQ